MLYENLVSDSKKNDEEKPTTSTSQAEEVKVEKAVEPQQKFETDALEAHNYNIWHQAFYSRPSIFLPNPPPRFKVPPADILSQINVAARFVAGNGAYSEHNLMGKS